MTFTADSLAKRVGGTVDGDGSREIQSVATLEHATPDSVSWIGDAKFLAAVETSQAGVILVSETCPPLAGSRTLIRVKDPDVALLRILKWLAPCRELWGPGVHATAFVHPDAKVEGAFVGANVYVGAGAVVGQGTTLHPGVYVGAMTHIGKECEFWPNVVVRERVSIGSRVIIHPNTTIGADGFGYLQRDGAHLKVPQIGTVVIENDVEIGANCGIDRARTGATRIGRGTKIDNLVQIGHNVEIGRGCIIIAQCGIGGSCKVGDYVMLAGQVAVVDHLHIGECARVAAKSLVCKNIMAGEIVRGIPAVPNQRYLRHEAGLRRVTGYMEEIKNLRDRVAQLESRFDADDAYGPAPDMMKSSTDMVAKAETVCCNVESE